jgi:hypothetical protein
MKVCTRCKEEKSLDSFNKKLKGLQPHCKSCRSAESKRYYLNNKSKIKMNTLEYRKAHRDENIQYAKKYRKTEKGKVVAKTSRLKQFNKWPERTLAGYAVRDAVKLGKLDKGPCEVCGTDKDIHGHHESYAKEDWLKVIWLCREHHIEWHSLDKVYAA